jgi:uncharacterized protein YutE (UPF0331/DUF86 family)
MVNADLVASKLAELAARVDQVRRHARATADDLAADRDALDIVSFNLMLAVQICADLASHLVADEGWPVARSLAEGFDRLAERSVIDPGVAAALRRAARFRNVVAHGYGGVDVVNVHAAATAGLRDLEAFASQVSAWVARRAGSGG